MVKKRRAVIIIGISLSVVFSISYYMFSQVFSKNNTTTTFYVIQVGAFSSEENALALENQIESLSHDVYTYKKEGLIYVLTCLTTDKSVAEKEMEWLNQYQISNAIREYQYQGKEDVSIDTMLKQLEE